MPPQRVQREHRRYNPCDCNHHKDLYKDWPSENATWRLASCMRRCPDKNCLSEEFKSASHLRRHAKTPFHKDLGIKVEKETPKYSSEPFFHRHSLTEDQDQDLKATHDSQESILQNGVRRLLEGLDVFDESTKAHLESIPLSTLDDISEGDKNLWEQVHTTYPRLFQSKKFWGGQPPTDVALFLATMKMISESKSSSNPPYTAFCRGEIDGEVDPSIALAQLWSHDPAMPVSLVGFNLPEILPKTIFRAPEEMSLYIEPFEEGNQQLLVTPTYSKTDLHIDPGEGLSLSLGSEKLCLLFPGTKHNLDLLQKAEGQKEKLARIGRYLEGGLITNMTSSHAIHIPLGSIHSVLTTNCGFLITIDFIAPTSAKSYSSLLSTGLDRVDGRRYQNVYFDRFILSIELALDDNRVLLGIDSWVKSSDRIEEWAGGHPTWSRKATRMWNRFLKSPESKNVLCPCGEPGQNQFFQEHFKCHYIFERLDRHR